jgi:acetylornithine deacetylase/succinyl-diaminopimelate desuccinylase-like protein
MTDLTGPTVELLQALIRNECVNDGTPESGHETRNAELLGGYLEGSGVGIEQFESLPGRGSVVARIEGSDPTAPTLCLMGHTDVVPVNPAGWSRDPFGGELVDGEVWGRGAIDMLNVTASMAVAFRQLARSGWKPKGTLIARTEVTREINSYIRSNKLQDPANGRKINPDAKLKKLLALKPTDELTYFNLQRYMSQHFQKAAAAAPVATA